MYRVSFSKKAEKEFLRLPEKVQKQFVGIIDGCQNNPFVFDCKKLKTPFEGYRIRSGNYRMLFVIENTKITIYSIKHRKDVYRK